MKKYISRGAAIVFSILIVQSATIYAMDSRVTSSNSHVEDDRYSATAWGVGHVTAKSRHYANVELNDYLCTRSIRSGRVWGTGKVTASTMPIKYENWNCDAAYLDAQLWTKIYYGFDA